MESWFYHRNEPNQDIESIGDSHSPSSNPNIHSPEPIRPSEDAQGKLTVHPVSSTPLSHLFPSRHSSQSTQLPSEYLNMTRRASPAVLAQGDRRPLSMGNPAVLGLWAFATVTILLGVYNLFLPHKSNHILYPTAMLFGGLAQYVAGFLDLFYGGTFSGTILVSYGAFWAGTGMMMLPTVEPVLDAYQTAWDLRQANAIYDFMWSFYTLMLLFVSFKVKNGTFILSWCLWWVFVTLFLSAIYFITDVTAVLRVSGVTAFLAAIGAYYSGCAAVFEEQRSKWWVGKYKWVKKR
ncbi:GPR1/FUN34/yaaH family-domain-containing protein [Dichotomocladium elegans]|nr:GPR1/FUN34/yaaH family-domain-containing protein [Dichotomocladium elegans]